MFLFLALFTVTPNLGGTFRLGKNPTSLTLIKDHCVESEIILFSYSHSACQLSIFDQLRSDVANSEDKVYG